jgi:glycosyltransferase involved in cell wall biosynthesis
MRIAFNALSVTNLSGRHVLLGHMRQIVQETAARGRHVLLHHAGNRDLRDSLEGLVDAVECPSMTAHWAGRWVWERFRLGRVLRQVRADAVFTPSGATTPGIAIPQWSLGQNPWCFVSEARKGPLEWLKASLQRLAYRRAQREATLMMFLSEYMGRMYRENAGFGPANSVVLYPGLDDETFAAARAMRAFHERRCEILVVSAMARHKSIEDVVVALEICRRNGIDVGMKLVGPWPDPAYEALVRERVRKSGLSDHVEFIGYVSREQLHRCYGEARVFCLLSRCESFGIPAVEAEAFGTPAVVADCGAPPEVAGPGGVVVPPGSPLAAAEALAPLLTDPAEWECASLRARANAERFRWTTCTKPLLEWIIANERS